MSRSRSGTLQEGKHRRASTIEDVGTCIMKPGDFDMKNKSLIGRGNYAKVFAVELKKSPKSRVAIKYPFREDADGPTNNDEIRILSAIKHPNIIQFYGLLLFESRSCFVMELAQHGTLHDVIIMGTAKIASDDLLKIQWMLDIAKGLAYLHAMEAPIVHGDVKSTNILVCSNPDGTSVAKLADFGIASQVSSTTTSVGGCSFLWSAPEVRTNMCKSTLSDVWSFAATVVEMFTSRQPYGHLLAMYPEKSLHSQINQEVLTPLSGLPQVELSAFPPSVRQILSNTLLLDYRSRWTMAQVLTHMIQDHIPHKVLLCTLCASGSGQARFVPTNGEPFLAGVRHRAVDLFPRVPLRDLSIFFTEEGRWRTEGEVAVKRAVQRWQEDAPAPRPDQEAGDYALVDPHDNTPVEISNWTILCQRFLADMSCLPLSGEFLPVIKAYTEVELLEMNEGAPVRTHSNAFFDMRFAVVLHGMRTGPRFFWRLHGEARWCDAESGERFEHEKLLPDDEGLCRVFLFLKDKDELPRILTPKDSYLSTLQRPDSKSVIEGRHLCIKTPGKEWQAEEWEMPRKFPSDFDQRFTAACRGVQG